MANRLLTDDFIDEAQVRFARATTKELARYIEDACAKQVAELERERDAHKVRADHNYRDFVRLEAELNAAESREKQARVEGAREALTRIEREMLLPRYAEDIRAFRDREYPATGEEPTRGEPSVFRTDTGFANGLRVGGSCADCQALNAEASVTWKFCPKHTLNLRPAQPAVPEPPSIRLSDGTRISYDRHNGKNPVRITHRDGDETAWFTLDEFNTVMRSYRTDDYSLAARFKEFALASRPTASGEG